MSQQQTFFQLQQEQQAHQQSQANACHQGQQQSRPNQPQQQAQCNNTVQAVPNQAVNEQGTVILTEKQVDQLIAQLTPVAMSNPVKITQPSYLITEEQMKYLLSLASGNPQQMQGLQQTGLVQQQQVCYPTQVIPTYNQPYQQLQPVNQVGSIIDGVANATLGTVGRVGHTLTTLADGILDVLTLGYGRR